MTPIERVEIYVGDLSKDEQLLAAILVRALWKLEPKPKDMLAVVPFAIGLAVLAFPEMKHEDQLKIVETVTLRLNRAMRSHREYGGGATAAAR